MTAVTEFIAELMTEIGVPVNGKTVATVFQSLLNITKKLVSQLKPRTNRQGLLSVS